MANLRLQVDTNTAAAVLFAAAIAGNLMGPGATPAMVPLTWAALAGGFLLSPKSRGPAGIFTGIVVIVAYTVLAVPGSILWGRGLWLETLILGLLSAPLVALYAVNHTDRVFAWLAPVFVVHAALVILQGPGADDRVAGLSTNANAAGGFLVVGAIYFLNTRDKWLAIPLLIALVFTGSRWAAIVMIVILAGMIVSRQLGWKAIALVAVAALIGLPLLLVYSEMFRIADPIFGTQNGPWGRLWIPSLPGFLPVGYISDGNPHNVPLRMAIETGILSAVAWVGINVWALCKSPRSGYAWWCLLAMVGLSMMDHYTWLGPLGGLWWLLISLRVKGVRQC